MRGPFDGYDRDLGEVRHQSHLKVVQRAGRDAKEVVAMLLAPMFERIPDVAQRRALPSSCAGIDPDQLAAAMSMQPITGTKSDGAMAMSRLAIRLQHDGVRAPGRMLSSTAIGGDETELRFVVERPGTAPYEAVTRQWITDAPSAGDHITVLLDPADPAAVVVLGRTPPDAAGRARAGRLRSARRARRPRRPPRRGRDRRGRVRGRARAPAGRDVAGAHVARVFLLSSRCAHARTSEGCESG